MQCSLARLRRRQRQAPAIMCTRQGLGLLLSQARVQIPQRRFA
jgi:hypothetical protein